jgi:hypothetical protein
VVSNLATEDVMGSTFNFIAVAALAAALAVPVRAQETAPAPLPAPGAPPAAQPQPQSQLPPQDSENRRFVFHRVDGNLLRLDTRTGAVDTCGPTGAEWTCAPGRDERSALDREIAKLKRDNATLKNALLERGVPLPDGMAPPPPGAGNWWSGEETIPRPPQTVPPATPPASPAPPAAPMQGEPAGSEFDRVVDAVKKGWRRLVEMMTDLQRDLQKK